MLMRHVFNRYAIRLEVDDTLSISELKHKLEEAKKNEEKAQIMTLATFTTAMKKVSEMTDTTETSCDEKKNVSAETIARLDPDYLNALREYHNIKAWKDALLKEIIRCSKNDWNPRSLPILPSAHARIATSLKPMLANILSHETLNRTFISLDILTSTIGKEFAAFLTDPSRCNDRKIVAQQIADCVAKQWKQKNERAQN
jgi:hypothetical protein